MMSKKRTASSPNLDTELRRCPMEDVELLEGFEDRMDLADIRAALAEAKKKGTKPLSALKKELGL